MGRDIDDEEMKDSIKQPEALKLQRQETDHDNQSNLPSDAWKDKVARYLAYMVDGGLLSS